jgi:hypothetical protein
MVTNSLGTRPVALEADKVVTTFVSAQHEPYVLEFGCEGSLFRISGSLSGAQAGNVNTSSLASTTTFAIGEGEQALFAERSEDGGATWTGPDASTEVGVAHNTPAVRTEIRG